MTERNVTYASYFRHLDLIDCQTHPNLENIQFQNTILIQKRLLSLLHLTPSQEV